MSNIKLIAQGSKLKAKNHGNNQDFNRGFASN